MRKKSLKNVGFNDGFYQYPVKNRIWPVTWLALVLALLLASTSSQFP